MAKRKDPPMTNFQRAPVTIKAGDQIMLGGSWLDVTGVEDTQIHWKSTERAGSMPLHMVKQSMVRPGDPVPEVAADDDCQAVAATLGNLAKHISKVVPDDDRERAAVILRVRGKDEHTIALPPSLKVVGSGEGWRAVKLAEELPAGEPQPVPEFVADPGDLTTEEIEQIIDDVAAEDLDDEDVSEQVMDTPLIGEDDYPEQDVDRIEREHLQSEAYGSDEDLEPEGDRWTPGHPDYTPPNTGDEVVTSPDAWDRKQFELDNAADELAYRKGDRLHAANGTVYKVTYAGEKILRVDFEIHGVLVDGCIRQADVPQLITAQSKPAGPNWDDQVVRLSAELIQAREKIRALEAELAQHAVEAAAGIEVIGREEHRVESKTLEPADIMTPSARGHRDEEIAQLRNDGWFVVFESATPMMVKDYTYTGREHDSLAVYHTVRLERSVDDDDAPGQGQPQKRDVLDQAADLLGEDADEGAVVEADAEALDTEVDLMPVSIRSRGEFPISEAIQAHGVAPVKTFFNTQVCEVFNLARAHTRATLPGIPSEVSS